ncbi:MAG: hypothetical protein ACKVU1_06040 [bacterium]
MLADLHAGEIAFGDPTLLGSDATLTTSDGHTTGAVVEGDRKNDRHKCWLTLRGAESSWVAIPVVRRVRSRPIPPARGDGVAEIWLDAPAPPGTHALRNARGHKRRDPLHESDRVRQRLMFDSGLATDRPGVDYSL